MRLSQHAPLLNSSINRIALCPGPSSLRRSRRRYASTAAYPTNIAVLGGGISGLASAYFISKEFPKSKITIYEAKKDLGGWIQSKKVDVEGGKVLFESGPRTLRPNNSQVTLQLIQDLGLTDRVITTQKDAPGATNRFIYYADQLNKLPSPAKAPTISEIWDLTRVGLFNGMTSVLWEPARRRRPDSMEDESVGDFISRRFDKRIANNLVSAGFHGIYAGDIWQLSARTLLKPMWRLEGAHGSVMSGFWNLQSERPNEAKGRYSLFSPHERDTLLAIHKEISVDPALIRLMLPSTMFSFKDGMSELVDTLYRYLRTQPNIDFKFGTKVESYTMANDSSDLVEVTTKTSTSEATSRPYSLVISTLRHRPLTPFTTVMTVNLFFPTPNLVPQKGFGYLIPQSLPFPSNTERALGVIFDSDAVTGQDSVAGTKLTVMLGGHYWDTWTHFPSESEGYDLAMSVVRRQLGITEEPTQFHVNLNRECIPQYTVGYRARVAAYAEELRSKFRGKVRVVGNQVGGVGVNDCVRGAWDLARKMRGVGWKDGVSTGLEAFLERDDEGLVAGPAGWNHLGWVRSDRKKKVGGT